MLPARRPYEDELLSSAVLRCCRQFNITEWKLGTVVLRQTRWRLSFLGLSALSSLSELFRQPPERLLWDHTAFPYVSAMMEAGLYEKTVAEVISDKSLVCWPSALLQRLTAGLSHRRFCQQCAEKELSSYRESYWHREHHLPGVWLCMRHGTALRQTNIPVRPHGPLDWSLPHECSSRRFFDEPVPDSIQRLLRVSKEWLYRLKLTQFRGHLILSKEGARDAEDQAAVPGGVQAADRRAGHDRAHGTTEFVTSRQTTMPRAATNWPQT